MPVPSSRTDLSAAAGSNSPAGSESVFPNLDNYLRAAFAFIRQNYDDIQTQTAALPARLPAGMIMIWSGSSATIPSGWVLCDGTNGTPDLRDRFVVGAGSTYTAGTTGGTNPGTVTTSAAGGHSHTGATGSHALTIAEIPAHTHTVKASPNGSGTGGSGPFVEGAYSEVTGSTGGGGGHTHTISAEADHTHTITQTLPPYYALCYVMKT